MTHYIPMKTRKSPPYSRTSNMGPLLGNGHEIAKEPPSLLPQSTLARGRISKQPSRHTSSLQKRSWKLRPKCTRSTWGPVHSTNGTKNGPIGPHAPLSMKKPKCMHSGATSHKHFTPRYWGYHPSPLPSKVLRPKLANLTASIVCITTPSLGTNAHVRETCAELPQSMTTLKQPRSTYTPETNPVLRLERFPRPKKTAASKRSFVSIAADLTTWPPNAAARNPSSEPQDLVRAATRELALSSRMPTTTPKTNLPRPMRTPPMYLDSSTPATSSAQSRRPLTRIFRSFHCRVVSRNLYDIRFSQST